MIYLRYFVMAWEITAWNEILDTTSKDLWLIRSPTFIVPNPPAPAACAILVCSFENTQLGSLNRYWNT